MTGLSTLIINQYHHLPAISCSKNRFLQTNSSKKPPHPHRRRRHPLKLSATQKNSDVNAPDATLEVVEVESDNLEHLTEEGEEEEEENAQSRFVQRAVTMVLAAALALIFRAI